MNVRRLSLLLPLLLLLVGASAAPAAPRVSGQVPIDDVPGRIVAWKDSAYVSVGVDSLGAQVLHRVDLKQGTRSSHSVGVNGRGEFLSIGPDGRTLLATERDSARVIHLQSATLPKVAWRELFPVSDPDPHVSWFGDGTSFLYQDILDDSVGTPSVFKYTLNAPLPKLYMFGCQRPLVAPSGDAVVCVGVDTLNPGPTRNLEMHQPVGLEDLLAGEFRWVAPLRTWVPSEGGWSRDGARIALVGYAAGEGTSARQLHVYSRIVNDKVTVPLTEDGRPGSGHEEDVAIWSPRSQWIAVPLLPSRGGGVQGSGGVWLLTPGGTEVFQLTPQTGTWRGAPIWSGDRTFLIADGGTPTGGRFPGRYWLVEFEEE